jgi:hydroxymethylpyrimidine pyrophosphatase-like HAD family hydrolase
MHKAVGLARLCRDLGIEASEVVALGDMPNDIPMLSWAGHGVAVANADPEVLAIANEVTSSHMDDGVAVVVERVLATQPR